MEIQNKKKNLNAKSKKLILFFLIAFLLSIIIIIALIASIFSVRTKAEHIKYEPLSSTYKIKSENDSSFYNTQLPTYVKNAKANELTVISTTFPPQNQLNSMITLNLNYQHLFVVINEVLVYHTLPNTPAFKTFPFNGDIVFPTTSNIYHQIKEFLSNSDLQFSPQQKQTVFIPISPTFCGSEIHFLFYSQDAFYANKIQPIYCGSQTAVSAKFISNNLPLLAVAFMFISVGTLIAIAYLVLLPSNKHIKNLILVATTFLLSGIWLLFDNPLCIHITDVPNSLFPLKQTLYLLAIIAHSAFIALYFNPRAKKSVYIFVVIFLVLQIFITVLLCIKSIPLFVLNLVLSVYIIALLTTTIIYIFKSVKKSSTMLIQIIFGIAMCITIILGALEQWILRMPIPYIFNSLPINMLVSFFPLAISGSLYIQKAFFLQKQQEKFKKIAYKDGLTSTANRTAFMDKLDEITTTNKLEDIYVAIFDLNNLKTVNDTIGHQHGDEMLKVSANIINEAFCDVGTIYRIGGDEFAMIAQTANSSLIDEALSKYIKLINQNNDSTDSPHVSIAYAIKKYDPLIDLDINDLILRTDRNMYEHKFLMKTNKLEKKPI